MTRRATHHKMEVKMQKRKKITEPERWLIKKTIQKIDNIVIDEWLKKAKRWAKKAEPWA